MGNRCPVCLSKMGYFASLIQQIVKLVVSVELPVFPHIFSSVISTSYFSSGVNFSPETTALNRTLCVCVNNIPEHLLSSTLRLNLHTSALSLEDSSRTVVFFGSEARMLRSLSLIFSAIFLSDAATPSQSMFSCARNVICIMWFQNSSNSTIPDYSPICSLTIIERWVRTMGMVRTRNRVLNMKNSSLHSAHVWSA